MQWTMKQHAFVSTTVFPHHSLKWLLIGIIFEFIGDMIDKGYYIAFIIFCAHIMCSIVIAMVIEAPTRRLSTTTYPPMPEITTTRRSTRRSTRRNDRQFRIRRTQASDIEAVSSWLASESIGVSQESTNWNDNINRLRAQSFIEKTT